MRPLPSEPDEFDKALRPYKLIVSPILTGASETLKAFELKPLTPEEHQGGVIAWAALFYQYSAEIDARLLVLLWTASILPPRLVEYAKDKKKRNQPVLEENNKP